jgi:Flp pilus assembly protein TadG
VNSRLWLGRERGSVTAFVVIITVALLFVAGLVIDGGFLLTTKRQAINVAEQAARAGAQGLAVEQIRTSGAHTLDSARAAASAQDYLATAGREGTVTVHPDRVEVTVTIPRRLVILGLGGQGEVTVTGTAVARNVRGVSEPET